MKTWHWIAIGLGVLVVAGVVIYFATRKKEPAKTWADEAAKAATADGAKDTKDEMAGGDDNPPNNATA